MKLTNNTFKSMIQALQKNYLNWELPDESITTWKKILELSISDELFPRVILDWMMNRTTPPKNPAEIIKHAREMFAAQQDSAEVSAEIVIDSARDAYYATEDYLSFTEEYNNSFASAMGTDPRDAYIYESIRKHSSNPKVLIMVYDECKGSVKDCFLGDAERGMEFLRNNIKKRWNEKTIDAATVFLKSGNTEIKRISSTVRRLEDTTNE